MRPIPVLLAAVLFTAGCSRGEPSPAPTPPPASAPATSESPASEGPTETEAAASEGPSEPARITTPLADLLTVPGISETRHWLRVGAPRRRTSFEAWLSGRQITGDAATLARNMHKRYGFDREVEVAFVHRRSARSSAPRTRQVLISSFERTDAGLSEAWCSVDEEGPEAVDLGSSARVQTAVDALVALPGSCGAVRRAGKGLYRGDISFRHGPLMVQVVAVEPKPIAALEGISRLAPRLHQQIVANAR